MAEEQPGGLDERVPTDRLSDVLEVFSRLETNSPARWDPNFFSGAGIAAIAALARFDLEDAESSELDALTALHRDAHRIEDRFDGYLGLNLGDVGDLRDFVDDVNLDHCLESPVVV